MLNRKIIRSDEILDIFKLILLSLPLIIYAMVIVATFIAYRRQLSSLNEFEASEYEDLLSSLRESIRARRVEMEQRIKLANSVTVESSIDRANYRINELKECCDRISAVQRLELRCCGLRRAKPRLFRREAPMIQRIISFGNLEKLSRSLGLVEGLLESEYELVQRLHELSTTD